MDRKFCIRVSNVIFIFFALVFIYIGVTDWTMMGHFWSVLGLSLSTFYRWFMWTIERDMKR